MTYQEQSILTNGAGARLRVLRKQPEHTWLFDLSSRSRMPWSESTVSLESRFDEGAYFVVAATGLKRRTPGMVAYAHKSFERFSPTFSDMEALFTESGRGAAFRKMRQTDDTVTYKTFMKVLRLWFAAGGVPDGILPDFGNCGPMALDLVDIDSLTLAEATRQCRIQAAEIDIGKATIRLGVSSSTVRGKPRKHIAPAQPTLYLVDRPTVRVFMKYWQSLKKTPGRTLKKAYDDMCLDVFSHVDEFGKVIEWDLQRIPSLRQFRRWYENIVDYKTSRLDKVTENDWNKNEREELGDEFSKGVTAGAVGSGDATIWNVGLRSRFPSREIIGPPVVFRIRDKRTGMLLGISCSLESASWNGFATAIANCFEDKVSFCAGHGISISSEQWPCEGLPASIEADCGESDNTKPDRFVKATGVRFKNIVGGRPEIKPGVESDFRTLQVAMNGDTPGALVERWQDAVGRNWRVTSTLDIDQFMTVLLNHELSRMSQLREGVHLTAEMIAAGVNTSCLSMWNWEVANRAGGLRSVNVDAATLSLLEHDSASVTGEGIQFRGLFYISADLAAANAFAKAKRNGVVRIKVAFDPRLVDRIYHIRADDTNSKCTLNMRLESQHDYKGKTFAEVRSLRDVASLNQALQMQEAHTIALTARRSNREIIAESKTQTKEASSSKLQPATQMKGLPKARASEKHSHSPTLAMGLAADKVAPEPVEGNVISFAKPKPLRPRGSSLFSAILNELPSTSGSLSAAPKESAGD